MDHLLLQGPSTVGDLVGALGLSQPNVSKHLRILKNAGWVCTTPQGQKRVYRLSDEAPSDVEGWLAPYRARWNSHLDAVERHLDARAIRDTRGTPVLFPVFAERETRNDD